MIRRPPRSTRTDTLFPYTTLFRSIDMDDTEHRASVLAELNKALAKDRTRTTVSNFSQLGLVEMTRKRTRDSLAHQLCEPCPTCQSRGDVKTARTVCYEIQIGRAHV